MELTNEKIKIQLQALLNKPIESITDEDLNSLKIMAINSKGLQPAEAEKNAIKIIRACKKLEELNFVYTYITGAIQEELSKTGIKRLGFSNCAFENEDNVVFSLFFKSLSVDIVNKSIIIKRFGNSVHFNVWIAHGNNSEHCA